MKKHFYTIQVDIYDGTLGTLETEISRAEYNRQRDHLEALELAEEHNRGDEFQVTHRTTTRDWETMTATRERWTNGASDIILTEYTAKDGYSFR